jgi:septum formation protein
VEELEAGDPRAVALENARRKALEIGSRRPTPQAAALVLGADTVVTIDGELLGKPRDAAQAREYVGRLAGRTHEVLGGIAVVRDGALIAEDVVATAVRFRDVDGGTLDWYVATGEWEGRAGGYAIQGRGAALVHGIDGDYLNVVGLPLARLLDLLPELIGIPPTHPLPPSGP